MLNLKFILKRFYFEERRIKLNPKIEIETRHCEPPVASDRVAIWGEAVSNC